MTYYQAIRALSPSQRAVLDAIAINEDGGHHPATLRALERRGLIEAYDVLLGGGTRMPIRVTRYRVPLAVHVAWAASCSEEVEQSLDEESQP